MMWKRHVGWAMLAAWLVLAGCAGGDDGTGAGPDAATDSGGGGSEIASAFGTAGPPTEGEFEDLLGEVSIAGIEPQTLDRIQESGDERFIAPLIGVMRFQTRNQYLRAGEVLDSLAGEDIGPDWAEWMRWSAENDPPLPEGYAGWRADQLAVIDPAFRRFIYEGIETTIRLDEVVWGGVRVDGIPALDNPAQIAPEEADYITPDELVFGVEISGDVRAYPLRMMDWHEMFNDVVGGVPVSLAYCTLCGAGILYDTTVDGEVYTFGSSGLLMRSNKLMYDRNTDSLWNQLTGEPVAGELVGSGIRLEILPVTVTTWEDWLSDHPDTTVLDIDTGFARPYEIGAAYAEYFGSPDTMFPVGGTGESLAVKDLIYALNLGGMPKAYPLGLLAEERVVNDVLGEQEVVLVASDAQELTSPEPGGAAVRAYDRGGHTFAPSPDGSDDAVVDEDGATWEVTEEALLGPGGNSLPRVAGHIAYWFGWSAYFPDTSIYEGASSS